MGVYVSLVVVLTAQTDPGLEGAVLDPDQINRIGSRPMGFSSLNRPFVTCFRFTEFNISLLDEWQKKSFLKQAEGLTDRQKDRQRLIDRRMDKWTEG